MKLFNKKIRLALKVKKDLESALSLQNQSLSDWIDNAELIGVYKPRIFGLCIFEINDDLNNLKNKIK